MKKPRASAVSRMPCRRGQTAAASVTARIVAAGKTSQQLERDLVKRYGGKYLQSPQVTVSMREYNSQRVTIDHMHAILDSTGSQVVADDLMSAS